MAGGGIHDPPSPPWLAPPVGYKPGSGAAFAAAHLAANSRSAAAAGRALLGVGGSAGGGSPGQHGSSNGLVGNGSAVDLSAIAAAVAAATNPSSMSSGSLPWRSSTGQLLAELQQRASQQNLANALSGLGGAGAGGVSSSQPNLFRTGLRNSGFSSQTLSQLQQSASGTCIHSRDTSCMTAHPIRLSYATWLSRLFSWLFGHAHSHPYFSCPTGRLCVKQQHELSPSQARD